MIYNKRNLISILKTPFPWKKKMVFIAAEIHSSANNPLFQAPNRRKSKNRHRNRGYAIDEFEHLSDTIFKNMFRIDKDTFEELLNQLRPYLQKNLRYATNSSGSSISVRTRLAVTLRWLAGGSYIDICFAWGIGYGTFFSSRGVLWPTIEAMNELFEIGVPIHDEIALRTISEGFDRQSRGILRGCIMAIDGLAVKTRAPYTYEGMCYHDFISYFA